MNKIWVCFIIVATHLITFTLLGQNSSKKDLTANDYNLWSSFRVEQLSKNAKWVSFSLNYESGNDSLLVKNCKGTKTYTFTKATKGTFCGDNWFIAICPNESLVIANLLTSKIDTVPHVVRFDLSDDSKNIIILKKGQNGEKTLEVIDLTMNKSVLIPNVDLYSYCRKANVIAYSTLSENNDAIGLLKLRNMKSSLIATTPKSCAYSNIVWQENGNSIAFLMTSLNDDKKTKNISVGYYEIVSDKLYSFNPALSAHFPQNSEIISTSFANLKISSDGNRIFFGLQKTDIAVDTSQIQIWNADDKTIYPSKIQIDGWNTIAKVGVWQPKENLFSTITDNEFPKMMLNENQTHALLFNPLRYEPQANFDAPVDIYILNLSTGEKKMILENQQGINGGVSLSIYKKHIVYFKNNNWWVYDITNGLHRNLTKELGGIFSDNESDWPEQPFPYGNPGWNEDEESLFLYDKYDIWSLALNGSKALRLTNGQVTKTTYRIIPQSNNQSIKMNYDGNYKGAFQSGDGLLIKAEGLEQKGYCFWNKKTGLRPLLNKKMRIPQFIATENNNYVYTEENFDSPTKLIFKKNQQSKEKVLFQSNPQHFKYHWGTSKLISYTNSKGTNLKGILFYPANYQSDKKYPLIVHVYEKQSKDLYKYINPSEHNPTGFNIVNFTSKGYFVLLPDIVYEVGNPGLSATDCVISATKKIIESDPINSTRIGLIGHSYGGYETDFIITQTNMFTAAVAGAAITDYVSGYLYVAKNLERPNFWHYEYGQLRIGKSLYEDYTGYLKNSPVYHANNIQTPLLSWAGGQDYHVHYYQSIEFYLALRRLGKTNTMLLYPEEGHVLSKSNDQKHLTKSIEKWFDYYLKENDTTKSTQPFINIQTKPF